MRPRSAPARRSGPSGRNTWSPAGRVWLRSLPAGRRGALSPPPFAALPATLVLSQAVGQARADLPGRSIGVRDGHGDRVLVHESGPETLFHRGQLGLVGADPDEQRRLVDVLLHDRRDHPAATILEVLTCG